MQSPRRIGAVSWFLVHYTRKESGNLIALEYVTSDLQSLSTCRFGKTGLKLDLGLELHLLNFNEIRTPIRSLCERH